MALEMVTELAKDNPKKWQEIETISLEALSKRILLWDAIYENLENQVNWSKERCEKNETYSLDYKN